MPHFEHCVNCIETPAINELIEENTRDHGVQIVEADLA